MIRTLFVPWSLLLVFTLSHEVSAQRVAGFAQRRSVSPYLNLFNNNNSGLNNYHSFVRPQLDQIQFNQQQLSQSTLLQQQLRGQQSGPQFGTGAGPGNFALQLQNALQILGPAQTGVGQPKMAANYFNYSHYYGVPVSNALPASGVRRQR